MKKENFEEEFLKYYNKGLSTKEICEILGISKNIGYKFIRKIGLASNSKKFFVVDEEIIDKIKEKYLEGKTIAQISKEFDFKKGTINYWLRKLKITRPRGKISDCDNQYFKQINTPSKAYFLGLLYADGGIIFSNNKKTLSLELKQEDRYILEEFKKELSSNLEVRDINKLNKTVVNNKQYVFEKHNSYFRVSCKELIEDLEKWGCVCQKTNKLKGIPDIPESLKRFFILGFFDGDGIASLGEKSKYVGFCGTLEMLNSIKIFLEKELLLPQKNIYYNKSNKIYYLQYHKKEEIEKIYIYFYDKLEIPHLYRKERKIKEMLKLKKS